jgi:uncharacterized protein YndB with AHSA1/START domain
MKTSWPLLLALGCLSAHAEVASSSAQGFQIHLQRKLNATPAASYAALGKIGQWWSDAHTWSGHAGNLSLEMKAGGCLCERWKDGEVQHGRVIYAAPGQLLRLDAPLGPLQSLAVNAVLSFELTATTGGTQLTVTFRVSGDDTTGQLAAPVDEVLTEQVDRYARFVATGNPGK